MGWRRCRSNSSTVLAIPACSTATWWPGQEEPCGVASLEGSTAELFIAPDFRGQGYGAALYDAAAKTPNLQAWAHGNLPAAQALAHSRDLQVTRKLVVMGIGEKSSQQLRAPKACH